MTDRTIRNLGKLSHSGSTARVLNLHGIWRSHGETEGWRTAPMFQNRILNRALILKHRLRRDEIDQFYVRRTVATKVILPIDSADLRLGGRYLFVNQIGFAGALAESFGIGHGHPDRDVLLLMDRLPSLDPFLLREQLRRNGHEPAACYFNVAEAELARMAAFVAREITPLVSMTLGPDIDLTIDTPVARLTAKILANSADEDMRGLARTLMLDPDECEQGVFSWKGFLYYKWMLQAITGEIGAIMEGVRRVKPVGRVDAEALAAIDRARDLVRRRIVMTCSATADMLRVYDDAFLGLTREDRPMAFRDFLRDAPVLFSRLGEQLGALQHIVSFWKYRTSPEQPPLGAEELLELLSDFEISLSGGERPERAAIAA